MTVKKLTDSLFVMIFSTVFLIEPFLVTPTEAYLEDNEYSAEINEFNQFYPLFENVYQKYLSTLEKEGFYIDSEKELFQLANLADLFQGLLRGELPTGGVMPSFATTASGIVAGTLAGAGLGPILGALLGGALALAVDAGVSLVEILVLAGSGGFILGVIGALIGAPLGFIAGLIVFAVIGAILFGVLGAITGGVIGVTTLVFAIIAVPILFIIGGILGIIIGGISGAIFGAIVGLLPGALVGAIVLGAIGVAGGAILGFGLSAVEQLLFIPLVLFVAAIGLVLGFFAGIPAGGILGAVAAFLLTASRSESASVEDQQDVIPKPPQPPLTSPVIPPPPNITLPPIPASGQNQLLQMENFKLLLERNINYTSISDPESLAKTMLDVSEKVFGEKVLFINNKIKHIINSSNLSTPEGINNATIKILQLLAVP